jgi:Trypsin-co-occurring domain 2
VVVATPVAVGLAEAIEALRAELMTAMEAGRSQGMQFSVEPVELTVATAVTRDANGKIGWQVFGVGGSVESASTQTLKLTLTPVWRGADGALVRDFTIADVQAAGEPADRVGPQRGSGA